MLIYLRKHHRKCDFLVCLMYTTKPWSSCCLLLHYIHNILLITLIKSWIILVLQIISRFNVTICLIKLHKLPCRISIYSSTTRTLSTWFHLVANMCNTRTPTQIKQWFWWWCSQGRLFAHWNESKFLQSISKWLCSVLVSPCVLSFPQ